MEKIDEVIKKLQEAFKIIDEEILKEQANDDGSFKQFANPAAMAMAEINSALVLLKEPCQPEQPFDTTKETINELGEEAKRQCGIACKLRDKLFELKNEIEKLQAELEKHHWIPVSERLPKTTEPVLVFLPCLYASIDRYSTKYQDWEKDDGKRVTHWKPIILPDQALKGGKE